MYSGCKDSGKELNPSDAYNGLGQLNSLRSSLFLMRTDVFYCDVGCSEEGLQQYKNGLDKANLSLMCQVFLQNKACIVWICAHLILQRCSNRVCFTERTASGHVLDLPVCHPASAKCELPQTRLRRWAHHWR